MMFGNLAPLGSIACYSNDPRPVSLESFPTRDADMAALKLAFIVADEREALSQYDLPEPHSGAAPSALLAGLKQCSEDEEEGLILDRRQNEFDNPDFFATRFLDSFV
jgi:hypothetical protein